MTFGMISIAETTTDIITLDTPIEELNGLTLNEFFIDNNYLTFTIGQNFNVNNVVYDENNVTFRNSALTVGFAGVSPILPSTTTTYFVTYKVSGTIGATYAHNFGNSSAVSIILSSQNQLVTTKQTATRANRLYFELYVTDTTLINNIHTFSDIYLINLTSLGLTSLTQTQLINYYNIYMNGGYYEYDAILNDLDMTDFIIISSSFVLWLWFMRFVKGVL
jgi:hypothetical protein